jgi:hypothetical protein
MKIVSLNGWGGKLHEHLTSYLRSEAPDILCLQEVVHTPDTEKDCLTYRDGDHVLQQRANFFRDIARALPDHQASFCPSSQGVLCDGAQAVPSQWGLATFVHRSLPITEQAQGFVHKAFSPHGYGEHPRSRMPSVSTMSRPRDTSASRTCTGCVIFRERPIRPSDGSRRTGWWTWYVGSLSPTMG